MFKLELEFETGNSAFEEPNRQSAIDHILKQVIFRIEKGEEYGTISDLNGNRVGQWATTETGGLV